MIAVDTNVLVRILVDDEDHADQCRQARRAAEEAGAIFVSQVVQLEASWVLRRSFGLSREQTVAAMESLLEHASVSLEARALFEAAVADYAKGTAEFADYLLLASSRSAGAEVVTFDKRFARSDGVRLLPSAKPSRERARGPRRA